MATCAPLPAQINDNQDDYFSSFVTCDWVDFNTDSLCSSSDDWNLSKYVDNLDWAGFPCSSDYGGASSFFYSTTTEHAAKHEPMNDLVEHPTQQEGKLDKQLKNLSALSRKNEGNQPIHGDDREKKYKYGSRKIERERSCDRSRSGERSHASSLSRSRHRVKRQRSHDSDVGSTSARSHKSNRSATSSLSGGSSRHSNLDRHGKKKMTNGERTRMDKEKFDKRFVDAARRSSGGSGASGRSSKGDSRPLVRSRSSESLSAPRYQRGRKAPKFDSDDMRTVTSAKSEGRMHSGSHRTLDRCSSGDLLNDSVKGRSRFSRQRRVINDLPGLLAKTRKKQEEALNALKPDTHNKENEKENSSGTHAYQERLNNFRAAQERRGSIINNIVRNIGNNNSDNNSVASV